MTQNFTPPPARVNPLELIPFLMFLGFLYIGATMGKPDRLPFEEPAKANQGQPLKPQCVAANPSPGVYEYRDCTPEELQESKPKFFNTLTQRWE